MAVIIPIDLSVPNDGLGDPLRDGGVSINANFDSLNNAKLETGGYSGTAQDLEDMIATSVGTVTSVGITGSDGIEIDSGSPITTSGTIALGLNQATTKTFLAYKEEEIDGTAIEDATFTGTENLDLETFTFADITLTGNTSITVTNTPAVNTSFVRNLTIRSTATETLTLPVSWVVIGTYAADGTDNYFTILFNNLTTAGASVICYISQA